MPTVNLTYTLVGGTPENINQVQQNFVDLRTGINGGLDGDNLTAAVRAAVGINDSASSRRGSSIIATSEAIAGAAPAALTTPDRVSNIVTAGGLIYVSYFAIGTKTVGGAGETWSVGVYIDGSLAKSINGAANAASAGQFGLSSISSAFVPTTSSVVATANGTDPGFTSYNSGVGSALDDITTGKIVGAFVPVAIAAGSHTIEMRFAKTAGATVLISGRRLYVETRGF